MPARDLHHSAVRNALAKDGWTITHDPYHISFGGFDFFIDLGAQILIGASKGGRKIAVEVKSFSGASSLSEFHTAVGQFPNYRLVLNQAEPERELYLAVSDYTYSTLLATQFGQLAVEAHQLRLVVFSAEEETVTQWLG